MASQRARDQGLQPAPDMTSEAGTEPDSTRPADRLPEDNDHVSEARRTMFRFNPARDILLLREVIGHRPFAAGYGQTSRAWDTIVRNLKGLGMDVCVTTVQGRYAHLKKIYLKEQMDQLRRSGTEEEYSEREQLLQDLLDLEKAARSENDNRHKERAAAEQRLEDQGARLRSVATYGRQRSSESESQEGQPPAVAPTPKRRRSAAADDYLDFRKASFEVQMEERRKDREHEMSVKEHEMSIRTRELDIRQNELALRKQELDMQR